MTEESDNTVKTLPQTEPLAMAKKRPLDPEVKRMLSELQEWCSEERGRQTEAAQILGVGRKRLYDWFSGRLQPSVSVGLRLQVFLRNQQRRKKSEEGT